MTDLKPCPFCGGEAKVYEMQYGADGQYSVFGVFCVDDSNSELIGLSKYQHGHFIDNFPTEAEAIAAWNSRAERTCKFTIEDNMNESEGMGDVWIECSTCHCVFDFYADEWLMNMNYCPNCGAKVVDR